MRVRGPGHSGSSILRCMGMRGFHSWAVWSGMLVVGALVACHAPSTQTFNSNANDDGDNGRAGSSARSDAGTRAKPPPPPATPMPTMDDEAAAKQLAACSADADGGATVVADAVAISDEYADSLHELIGCG